MQRSRLVAGAIAGISAACLAGFFATRGHTAGAADHLDPPGRTNPMMGGMDRNADIADVYAWHQGTGATATVVNVLSFSGPNMPVAGQKIPCDRDVLYQIHISNNADLAPEFDINIRFGEDDTMPVHNCLVQLTGIPGLSSTQTVLGPVEHVLQQHGVMAYAGLRDDAFFFDLQGFKDTLSSGHPMMTSDRDFFAGQNTSAIVVQYPQVAVSPMGQPFRIWATTSRKTGP